MAGGARQCRAAVLAAAFFCALISLTGCASTSYLGIPLAAGAADPALQDLARSARSGDKHAQLELGIRYEEGRGVAVDLTRAERLYRSAALQAGGVRIAHLPAVGRNGGSAAVPISAGRVVPGLAEAEARLAALQARRGSGRPTAPPTDTFFREDGSGSGASDPLAEAFATLIRIELHSDRCFGIGREGMERYSDYAWRCITTSALPANCTQYPDAILRAVRFIRFNPSFTLLQASAVEAIERCVAPRERSIDDVYASRARANLLDLVLLNLGHATETQTRYVATYLASYETHGPRHPPVRQFSESMCRRLLGGISVEPASFWLLFCNSGNLDFSDRAQRTRQIDDALSERGIHASRN